LATHVEDDAEDVAQNRLLLKQALHLPAEPQWLQQTHSTRVIDLQHNNSRDGDAAVSRTAGQVVAVLTADCLPVLFCDDAGSEVAAAHAGWRGLLNGVLEQTVASLQSKPQGLLAWLGPAIGPQHFEVGSEVRQQFVEHDPQADQCFKANRPGHYLADLYSLARQRLKKLGITHICGGELCTFSQADRFFSYRREKMTGRQACLIYINK
jgi:YfiH family protein